MNDDILLEPEHKALLVELVEYYYALPANQRQSFTSAIGGGNDREEHFIFGPGQHKSFEVPRSYVRALAAENLIDTRPRSADSNSFDITPKGFAYYRWLTQQAVQPTQQNEPDRPTHTHGSSSSQTSSGQQAGVNYGTINQHNYYGTLPSDASPPEGERPTTKAGKLARMMIEIEGHIEHFTEKEREAFIWNLSRLLNVSEESIRILRVTEGSIKIELTLPEEAARQLESMYQNNDPALEQLQAEVQGVQVETYDEEVLIGILRKARALALARNLASDLASAFDPASDLASVLDRSLASALDRSLASARASALELVLASTFASDLFIQLSIIADKELGPDHEEAIEFKQAVEEFQLSLQTSEDNDATVQDRIHLREQAPTRNEEE
jgi:hypothetical protein